jgi:hypothetical protein
LTKLKKALIIKSNKKRRQGAANIKEAYRMNANSHLCRFIAAHPTDFEERLAQDYRIKVRREGALAIFNYHVECRFSDPIVQESRGIIIDCERCEVVCWPFRKFGNHNEGYADSIDWTTARVQEKVDGSIIKLWYDRAQEKWQFSTNGVIRAENANVDERIGLTYHNVILHAENYRDIPFDTLDKDSTYIFELVSPETQVVVRYDTTMLYHLGTRSNLTGKERDEDIGIRKPASYPLASLAECLDAAATLNREDEDAEDVTKEGFVVVDADWHRVKVKSPDYLVMHRLRLSRSVTKEDCLSLLLSGSGDVELLCSANPTLIPTVKYYDFRLAELCLQADQIAELARGLYTELNGDRGAVAAVLLRHKLSPVGFRALTCPDAGRDILLSLDVARLAKYIDEYEPVSVYDILKQVEE